MTDKRQKATEVKCKREESREKQSIFVEYTLRGGQKIQVTRDLKIESLRAH